ncbi:MAG: hypothetical protein J7K26_00655 [Candidatus Aenigmarchaeota archaeon]|nr:hypothetical protein [Candidatus Aenigmarchaeota archaeon]
MSFNDLNEFRESFPEDQRPGVTASIAYSVLQIRRETGYTGPLNFENAVGPVNGKYNVCYSRPDTGESYDFEIGPF